MKSYWVNTMYATARIEVDDKGIIVKTAPIWAKWRNQKFEDFKMAHNHQGIKTRIIHETKD